MCVWFVELSDLVLYTINLLIFVTIFTVSYGLFLILFQRHLVFQQGRSTFFVRPGRQRYVVKNLELRPVCLSVICSSLASIISPLLNTHMNLYVALTRTKGRTVETLKKIFFFSETGQHWIVK